jgi:hypothetical protein
VTHELLGGMELGLVRSHSVVRFHHVYLCLTCAIDFLSVTMVYGYTSWITEGE